ncbi:MAG: nitrogenase [Oscillospiraceae bacterium]|nr:nitrogenase [Oscillospiraceae bacterium]
MSKVNLEIPEVEIREIRLGSITGFQGTAGELVGACGGCSGRLKDKNRSFSQCLGCGTSNAACTLTLIQDAAIISHGPVGCSTCLHEFAFTYRVNAHLRQIEHPTQRKIFSTNLEEKDTIYGGGKKLEAAIREVYRRADPKAIFVITTCAAGIIGDDVETITNAAEAELGIPVVAVFCEGFRSKIWTSGFDAGYHGIARKIIKPPREKRNIINVINFWGSDVFREWFAEFGYEPNYITPFSTVDTLSYSSEAALTVQACSTLGSYLGAALEQVYGVPEIRNSPPYGIAQTDRWFRELGKILGKEQEAEAFLQRKKEEYMPKIEALRERLKGKTAYVTAGASHGQSLLALLSELGMKPQGAAIFHHDPVYDNESPDADTLAHTVADYGDVPNYNVCNKQEFELVNVLNRIHPDILLARHGGMTLWGAKLGIPSLLIGDEHFGMGYEGLVAYGERIADAIENDEFVKNLRKHAVNPYTKWWMEQDPYTFLGRNF